MLDALSGAFSNLRDSTILRSLLLIALMSAAVSTILLVFVVGSVMALQPGVWIESGVAWLPSWLADGVVFVVATLGSIALVWFTFVLVVQGIASFFLDRIVARVEEIDYPDLPKAKGTTPGQDIVSALRFLVWLVLVNLAALPFYLLGILIPGLTLIAFWLVNSYLFAREYAEIVLLRRHGQKVSDRWRRKHRLRLLVAGALVTFGMSIPLLNLAIPVLAAAFMTHVCHRAADAA